MTLPKVSVLIPSYNQDDIIEETLKSTLMQDYDNLEVVVADDASNDDTPKILMALQAKHPQRLKVLLFDDNLGVTKNHTRGLLQCTGNYVAFQDGDDLFLPGKICKQVVFMQEHPDCAICFHDVDVFDSDTDQTLYYWSKRFGHREGGLNTLVKYGNFLPSVSVMVLRKNLPAYGYDDRIRIGSDWMLWLEVLSRGQGRICYMNEVLARYRRHASNLTNSSNWKYEDQLITLALVETKWPQLLFPVRLRRSEIQFMMGMSALSQKKIGNAFHYIGASIFSGFPFFPWARLISRELAFRIRHGGEKDDILGSIVSAK